MLVTRGASLGCDEEEGDEGGAAEEGGEVVETQNMHVRGTPLVSIRWEEWKKCKKEEM
jgi:hypothetical protein